MKCTKCKRIIPDDAKLCCYCGLRLNKPPSRRTRGNGTGTAYRTPSGKWQVEVVIGWNLDTKRPIRRTKGGFTTKKSALEYAPILMQREEKKATSLYLLHEGWKVSALPKLSKSKQTAYRIAYDKLTSILYQDITTLRIDDLQRVVDTMGASYYTKRDMKVLLSHLYNRAVAQQDVMVNLAKYIELPMLEEAEPVPFSDEEQKLLWKHYADGDTFVGYILLMVYSGMMPGELMKADKDMIKWDKQTIEGAGLKTKERKKKPIVIADLMIPVLQSLCAFSESEKLMPMKRNDFYKEFDAALRRCGCRDLTPYACRHTTATALTLGEIPPATVQAVMRHAKYETTKRYIHFDTAPMLAALNKALGTAERTLNDWE